MEQLIKKFLSAMMGMHSFLFSSFALEAQVGEQNRPPSSEKIEATQATFNEPILPISEIKSEQNGLTALSVDEQAAIQEMSNNLKITTEPIAENVGGALLNANVRADSQDPQKFESNIKIEFKKFEFDTSSSFLKEKKWIPIKVIFQANAEDVNVKWTKNCEVKLYIGFYGCFPDGKMLFLKASCECATLPTNVKQSVLFFLPNDVRQQYGLTRVPDYCSIIFIVNGVKQDLIIVNKEGKNAYDRDPKNSPQERKKNAHIENRILRNVDQLPVCADVNVGDHPSLLLEIDS